MITITNEQTTGNFEYASGNYTLTGKFAVGLDGVINQIDNGQAMKTEGGMIVGYFSAYKGAGDESARVSINNIEMEDIAAVSTAISACMTEIAQHYAAE